MPKINGKNIDPKVYAKRVTQAKKTVAAMDPAVKAKIKDMYPKVKKESIANKALNPKKAAPKATATPKATVKPKPKATPLSPSEKAFLAGQKKKAQITKRTGVYPNTAN